MRAAVSHHFLFLIVFISFRMQRDQELENIHVPNTVVIAICSVCTHRFRQTFESGRIIHFIEELAHNCSLIEELQALVKTEAEKGEICFRKKKTYLSIAL